MPTETLALCPYCGVGCGLLVYTGGSRVRALDELLAQSSAAKLLDVGVAA